jgi:hypothetical protein
LQISGEFERVHEYRYYFPANNISNVLSRIWLFLFGMLLIILLIIYVRL